MRCRPHATTVGPSCSIHFHRTLMTKRDFLKALKEETNGSDG